MNPQIIRYSVEFYLRLSRKMLVEDLMDLEVRITIRTSTFPITPTARTRLGEAEDFIRPFHIFF